MKLRDLFPESQFVEAIDSGLVSARKHPTDELVIYNYTPECQYSRAWNECTTQCRGLIATYDGEVVARPFPKFFNYGEPDAPELDLLAPARVTDKVDGSLGILYQCQSGIRDAYRIRSRDKRWAIATRGSFESEQAHVGTEILGRYLEKGWVPLGATTYLFEIVYPENRIVVDYGDTYDLILLAVLDTRSGQSYDVTETTWPGPVVETFSYGTLAEALLAPPRPNREGLVVDVGGTRVKLKQEDYVALHRIVTGLSARVVWEQLGEGLTVDAIKAPLPEEFADWVDDVAHTLFSNSRLVLHNAEFAFQKILKGLPAGAERKEFALEAQKPDYEAVRPFLFMLLDGKDPTEAIWKLIKPAGNLTPRDFEVAA